MTKQKGRLPIEAQSGATKAALRKALASMRKQRAHLAADRDDWRKAGEAVANACREEHSKGITVGSPSSALSGKWTVITTDGGINGFYDSEVDAEYAAHVLRGCPLVLLALDDTADVPSGPAVVSDSPSEPAGDDANDSSSSSPSNKSEAR